MEIERTRTAARWMTEVEGGGGGEKESAKIHHIDYHNIRSYLCCVCGFISLELQQQQQQQQIVI